MVLYLIVYILYRFCFILIEVTRMRISTLDPISMNDVLDLDNAPFIIGGGLKIYFESEDNKNEYVDIPMHGQRTVRLWIKSLIMRQKAQSQALSTDTPTR
jgi:hypothetical protein